MSCGWTGLNCSASLGLADIGAASHGAFHQLLGGFHIEPYDCSSPEVARYMFLLLGDPGLALSFWFSGIHPTWLSLRGPLTFWPHPSGPGQLLL